MKANGVVATALIAFGVGQPAICSLAQDAAPQVADLMVVNADVVTMDRSLPRVSAFAVKAGRIQALGSMQFLESLRGAETEVVDAGGRTVLPGFVDSHLHLLEYGQYGIWPSLRAKSLEEIEAIVRELPNDGTIHRFLGWGAYRPEDRPYPTSELLDRWAPDIPVVFDRGAGHVALFNSAALRVLAIERLVRERGIPAEQMERDENGRPTGILVEEALWAAVEEMDRRSAGDETRRAVEITLRRLAEVGVTSVRNILFTTSVLNVYRRLLDEGVLTARIDAAIMGRRPREVKERMLQALPPGGDPSYLSISAAKYFSDGAIGPGTAALLAPYDYDSERYGILHWENGAELAAYLEDDLDLGLQSMVHAMGDRAARVTLDAFQTIVDRRGPADYRFRIEHGNMPTPEDFERWQQLPVVWSYQPPAWSDRYRSGRRRALGDARLEYTENVQAFLDRGMPVAVGSDAPYYVNINPLVNVQSLVASHTHNTSYPRNIPVMRALEMVTIGAAYAARQEDSRGTLAVGKLADFVILSDNPLRLPPEQIGQIQVLRTVVGGKTVWRR
jgi:predicted amidohydrolase YtcJ